MSEVFYLLCGLLYLIGLPLGWNYEDTSVYICIYAFPVLVTLPFLGMFIRMLRLVVTGRRRVLSSFIGLQKGVTLLI